MKALVIYDSKFGNTEQVAQAIADTLGEEGIGQLISVDEADALEFEGVDLLVLGGPTQRHGLSPAVRAWLELIPRGVMRGLFLAAFDTCYRMLQWKSGSAALAIARKLRSTKEKKIAGIRGGLGRYFEVDRNLVRLGLILLALDYRHVSGVPQGF